MSALNEEVRRYVYVNDAAEDPVTGLTISDFTTALTVHDTSDDSLDSASETVSLSEIGSGGYWFIFTPSAPPDDPSLYRLTITPDNANHTATPDEFQINIEGFAASVGPYLTTRANVKAALGISKTGDDSIIDTLLPHVSDLIESICRRTFLSGTETETLEADGDGINYLILARYPVTSITTVHESTTMPRAWDSDSLLDADTAYLFSANKGILHRVGSFWSAKPQSIRVVYVAGFASVPGDIERAAIEIIATKLAKGKGQLYHLTGEDRGDGEITGIRFDDIPDDAMRTLLRHRSLMK